MKLIGDNDELRHGINLGGDVAPVAWDVWLPVIIAAVFVVVTLVTMALLVWPTIRTRLAASRMGVDLSVWRTVRLGMRGVDVRRVLAQLGRLRKAHIHDIGFDALLDHTRDGGRTGDVVDALIHARRSGVGFDWAVLCQIDLAGESPSRLIDRAVKPWRIDVPGELLGGEALPATAGDGVELRIRGEARVVAAPEEDYPLPRACAVVADLAKQIVVSVRSYRDHRDLLRNPRGLEQMMRGAGQRPETGIRVIDFRVTQLEASVEPAPRPEREATEATPAAASRAVIDRMLAAQPIERMPVAELIELAPACLQFGDYATARRVCEQALRREPDHPRACMWLHEAMHHAGAPLAEQLELAERCVERQVSPRTAWRLIRASILCRLAVETGAEGKPRIVDAELYRRAADELRSMQADADGGERLVERGIAEGWIDDADTAFPGLLSPQTQTA